MFPASRHQRVVVINIRGKFCRWFSIAACVFACATGASAADEGLGDKAKQIASDTTAAVEKAGVSAAERAKEFWQRIDAARLKNRTADELVAWVIMGVLVGAIAGSMTSFKPTGLGKAGRLGLGLVGAFIGGIVVHLGRFDFGWGPVLIRYEELFFALVGAVLLILAARFIKSWSKKPTPPQ